MTTPDLIQITPAQARFADWMADVLVYTVVLNLFVEYVDTIVIDSFTISIFTAVVLKALLDGLGRIEHGVMHYFKSREGTAFKVLGFLSVWGILFLSKFVILEVIDIIFRDHVELHGFIEIVSLIVAMILAREVINRLYRRLGTEVQAA